MKEKIPVIVFISVFTVSIMLLIGFFAFRSSDNEIAALLLSVGERVSEPDRYGTLTRAQITYKQGAVDRRLIDGQIATGTAYRGTNIEIRSERLTALEEKNTLFGYSNARARAVDKQLRLQAEALLAKNEGIKISDFHLENELSKLPERIYKEYGSEAVNLYLAGGEMTIEQVLEFFREDIRASMAIEKWELLMRNEYFAEKGISTLTKQAKKDVEYKIEAEIAAILKADKVKEVRPNSSPAL